jgi:hypothetical protein
VEESLTGSVLEPNIDAGPDEVFKTFEVWSGGGQIVKLSITKMMGFRYGDGSGAEWRRIERVEAL